MTLTRANRDEGGRGQVMDAQEKSSTHPFFLPPPHPGKPQSHVTSLLLRTCVSSSTEGGQMQLEIKSRKLNLKGDQRCLTLCILILPRLFSNQILSKSNQKVFFFSAIW